MTGWEPLYCANHPDRIAIERCEVCNKPLCAYCLYYTEDGQRLCEHHAAEARRAGLVVEEPGQYADQLIGTQASLLNKRKHHEMPNPAAEAHLYKGTSTDLMSLIGMLIGLIALSSCCGAIYFLPLVGLALSLIALINAKKSYDPGRTRRMSLVGLTISGLFTLILVGCILWYAFTLQQAISIFRNPNIWNQPMWWTDTPTATPVPTQVTPSPTLTPTPESDDGIAYRDTAEAPFATLAAPAP